MKKSFTLVELLVVIAIIGILATFIIINVSASRSKARDAKRVNDLKTVQTALEMYKVNFGHYPISGINPFGIGGCASASGCVVWKTSASYPDTWVPCVTAGYETRPSVAAECKNDVLPLLTPPLDPINQTTTKPYYAYAYASATGVGYKLIEYNFEKNSDLARNDESGAPATWGDSKYELFTSDYKACWGRIQNGGITECP